MTTTPATAAADALAQLCARAGADPGATSVNAAHRVIAVWRRDGVFAPRVFPPPACPLAAWLGAVTGVELEPGRGADFAFGRESLLVWQVEGGRRVRHAVPYPDVVRLAVALCVANGNVKAPSVDATEAA